MMILFAPNVCFVSVPHQHGSSVFRINRMLYILSIFRQTGPPHWLDALACGILDVKCFSQGHNDALPSSEIEPRANNLAVANLLSHPLSFIAANMNDSIKCLSLRTTTICPVWASNLQPYDYYMTV